jgi:hypothetical protein
MKRYTATIGSKSYILAQGHAIDELRSTIVNAVHSGGAFVEFVVLGNREISALVTAGLPVIIEAADVEEDDRDTGDVLHPFMIDPYDL